MTSHSKEPWVAGPNILQLVCSEPDQVIVVEPFGMSDSKYLLPHDVRVANARRIVACVNICAGISTEELEQHGDLVGAQLASEQKHIQDLSDEELTRAGLVRSDVMCAERQELAASLEEVISKKVAQRDELVLALKNLVARAECYGMGDNSEAYAAAQAVLAKARGDA